MTLLAAIRADVCRLVSSNSLRLAIHNGSMAINCPWGRVSILLRLVIHSLNPSFNAKRSCMCETLLCHPPPLYPSAFLSVFNRQTAANIGSKNARMFSYIVVKVISPKENSWARLVAEEEDAFKEQLTFLTVLNTLENEVPDFCYPTVRLSRQRIQITQC